MTTATQEILENSEVYRQSGLPGLVLPQTSPILRRRRYTDIEALIMPGFLTTTLQLGSVNLSLRSLSHQHLALLRERVGPNATSLDWKLWMIASSVWMASGEILLEDPNSPPKMKTMLGHFPPSSISDMWRCCLDFVYRTHRASEGVEAYSFEKHSRFLWGSLQGRNLSSPSVTGIAGTGGLGINMIQQLWTSLNRFEDSRINHLRQWSNSKFVASANSPKAVRTIDQKDKLDQERDEKRRQAVMDQFYYRSIGILGRDGIGPDGLRVSSRPMTDQELQESYRKWVDGEIDWHDKVILTHKETMKRRYEEQGRRLSGPLPQPALPSEEPEVDEIEIQPLVAYTPEQMRAIMASRTPGKPGARDIGWEEPNTKYYHKYLQGKKFSVDESPQELASQASRHHRMPPPHKR
jgi:hypothetical protein